MKKVLSVFLALLFVLFMICPVGVAAEAYKVKIGVHFIGNLIFSRYDVDIYYKSDKIAHLKHGNDYNGVIYADEGRNYLYFYRSDDKATRGVLTFDVRSDTIISCSIHCHIANIDIDDLKVKAESTKTTPTPDPNATPSPELSPTPDPSLMSETEPDSVNESEDKSFSLRNGVVFGDDMETVKQKENGSGTLSGNTLVYENRKSLSDLECTVVYYFENDELYEFLTDYNGFNESKEVNQKNYLDVNRDLTKEYGAPTAIGEEHIFRSSFGALYIFENIEGVLADSEKKIERINQWQIPWQDNTTLLIEHVLGSYKLDNAYYYSHIVSYEYLPEIMPEKSTESIESEPSADETEQKTDDKAEVVELSEVNPNEWTCPNCGIVISSKFCPDCGTARPNSEMLEENKTPVVDTPSEGSELVTDTDESVSETVIPTEIPTPTATIAPTEEPGATTEIITETLTVEPVNSPNRSIKISSKQSTVDVKKQIKLIAEVERLNDDAPKKSALEWSSSDEKIAKVSNQGVVIGVSKGKATITCRLKDNPDIKATYTVSVIKKISGIKISEAKISIAAGYSSKVKVTFQPADASDRSLTWASSDSSVAQVQGGSNGECTITAKKQGDCIVTATTKDGSNKKVSVKVHVQSFGVFENEYTVTSKKGLKFPIQWGNSTVTLYNKSSDLFDADWVDSEVFINPKKAGKGYIELQSNDSSKDKVKVNIIVKSSAVYDVVSYPTFVYSAILRNPSSYKGRQGHINGKVLQVSSSWGKTILRVGTSGYFDSDDVFWVECDSRSLTTNIIEDDRIVVYGTCIGTHRYTTILGASITIPSIKAEKINFK